MTEMSELQWFHRLAEREIDPALDAVAADAGVMRTPDAWPARQRSLLTVQPDPILKPLDRGDFEVAVGPNNTVELKVTFGWKDNGKSSVVATFPRDAVKRADVEKLARSFLADFRAH
jgi:hypothetical protein